MASDKQVSEKTKDYLLKLKYKFQSNSYANSSLQEKKLRNKDPITLLQIRTNVQTIKLGDSLPEALAKYYRLLRKEEDQEILSHELEKDFLQEKIEESDRDDEHFLKELAKLKKTATPVEKDKDKKDKEKKSFLDQLKKLLTDLSQGIKKIISGVFGSTTGKIAVTAGGAALLTSSKGSVPRKQVYEYLISKGVDHNHAMGMMANIQGESSFQPGAYNPNDQGGPSGGLFQWHDNTKRGEYRFSRMRQAIPDWQTNWKAQIDYALQDKDGNAPQYLATSYSSPSEATTQWVRLFERPKDAVAASKARISFIPSIEKEVATFSGESAGNSNNEVATPKPETKTTELNKTETKTAETPKASIGPGVQPRVQADKSRTQSSKPSVTKVVQLQKTPSTSTAKPVTQSTTDYSQYGETPSIIPQQNKPTDSIVAEEANLRVGRVTLVSSQNNTGANINNGSASVKMGKKALQNGRSTNTNILTNIVNITEENVVYGSSNH